MFCLQQELKAEGARAHLFENNGLGSFLPGKKEKPYLVLLAAFKVCRSAFDQNIADTVSTDANSSDHGSEFGF